MASNISRSHDRRTRIDLATPAVRNGHELLTVKEKLPGREPSDYDLSSSGERPHTYTTTYYRCRHCGQERNHVEEFREPCRARREHPVSDGGYSVADPRTRRALSEELDVRFGEQGSTYVVEGSRGIGYLVDLDAETCTCPDFRNRAPDGGCKHLRRVDIEVRVGTVPAPDGQFRR